MNRLTILMYHGLIRHPGDLQHIDAEDRPYTLGLDEFEAQLDALVGAGIPVHDPSRLELGATLDPGVIITFDDGHASNAELALPALRARAMSACFFVTTGFVGQRPGYCSWNQVRELSSLGMHVGGHGHSHRFLADLDDAQLRTELGQSSDLLHRHLGIRPRQMSFPGGRYDARAVDFARRLGFEVLYGSVPGALSTTGARGRRVLPRIAVRPGMSLSTFTAYARADLSVLVRARSLQTVKSIARGILGHERYHRLYARLRA